MELVISIPVHEKQYVVINQIKNIKKYVPSAHIVIHISTEMKDCEALCDYISQETRVYQNPQRLLSGWGDIIDAHISNYKFIKGIIDFDYIMFHASNDMYILPGVEQYISQYDAGFHVHQIYKPSRWWPSAYALEDSVLNEIIRLLNAKTIVATQIESSFYRKELFEEIVAVINEARALEKNRSTAVYEKTYTREEVYFSTIAYHLLKKKGLRRGYPTTYSEVHDFDRALWRKQFITWGIYHRLGLWKLISKSAYVRFERGYSDRFAIKNPTALSINTVKKLVNDQSVILKKHSYLNDSVTKYRLYGDHIFSVKRVPREIDDPLRVYINNL